MSRVRVSVGGIFGQIAARHLDEHFPPDGCDVTMLEVDLHSPRQHLRRRAQENPAVDTVLLLGAFLEKRGIFVNFFL